jgi:beta-ketoacyl synthase-like protein
VTGARLAAIGLVTGWGTGVDALPEDAAVAAGDRRVIAIARPPRSDDRFRRATRECLLGIAAVDALLERSGLDRDAIRGDDTALVYVTAAAYASANRAFIDAAATGSALHFPYTAPSAVPAEVSIEFGLTGPYVILIGGAAATVDALWQACTLVGRGEARRALVLAVETFAECEDLWRRGRRLLPGPLTEAAGCALVVPDEAPWRYDPITGATARLDVVRRRAGETLSVMPLIAHALATAGDGRGAVEGPWRGRRAMLDCTATGASR